MYISGSDVASICGVGFLTRHQLWMVKTGRAKVEKTDAMAMGNILEEAIRDRYMEICGYDESYDAHAYNLFDPQNSDCNFLMSVKKTEQLLREKGFYMTHGELGIYVKNKLYPNFSGHLDDYNMVNHNVIEYKATRDYITECPIKYILQTAFYCILTDSAYGKIAVLHNTVDLSIFTYQRNKPLEDYIIMKANEFYEEHLVKDAPPEATTLEDTTKRNIELYSSLGDKPYIANENTSEAIQAYQAASEELKEKEKLVEAMKLDLLNKFKESELIVDAYGNDLATYKFNKTAAPGVNKKILQADFPEVWEKVKEERVPTRTLRIKKR